MQPLIMTDAELSVDSIYTGEGEENWSFDNTGTSLSDTYNPLPHSSPPG